MKERLWKNVWVVLYVVLMGVLAIATFLEHAYGTTFVQTHIYHACWFCGLWGALAFGLVRACGKCRLWKRLPVLWWHGSLLVILGGAMLTYLTGEKGYVHLVQGQEVKSFTRTSDQQTRVLPFSLSLDSFRVVYYPGTEAPSDYKSYVSYKVNGKWKEEVISMNHILSVEGYRFYQSSYDPDLSGSWLSVNYDPWGIAVTYAGYLCLAFSSLWLLGSRGETFFRLLRHPLWRKTGLVWLGLCAFQLTAQARPVSVLARQDAEKLKMRQVIYHDRVAPFHTLARDFVIKLSGKPSYHGLTPEQVVASWLLYPEEWQHEPMFRVKSERLRQELGLKSEYAALVDLFDGKTYRLEGLLQRLQDEVRNTHEKGWLENRRAKKLEKEVLELDEKVGMVLMLQKGTFIRPLPEDGSVTPLSPLRIRAEIFYHAVPFTKILFMANLSLGLLALGWWVCSYVMQEGDKTRNWRSRWRRIWVWAVWMACLFHWTSYLLRWYIGGRIPLGNGHETMLFLAGFLLLCTCIWQRRFSFLLPAGLLLSGFTLLVAYLSEMNPQITPLMPVLLSPWLSLHVSLIMVSYALFALMCLCSILALSIRRHTWQRQRLTLFCRVLLYPAVLCLGIGIFIGAVWANVSWGSYWAWDPKEVWALVTFMLYGMAFHVQSLPRFKNPYFFHWFLIVSFSAILMTYFGVNYVLGGMHSYAG